eukprot:2200683-Amphidinium_carterae.2
MFRLNALSRKIYRCPARETQGRHNLNILLLRCQPVVHMTLQMACDLHAHAGSIQASATMRSRSGMEPKSVGSFSLPSPWATSSAMMYGLYVYGTYAEVEAGLKEKLLLRLADKVCCYHVSHSAAFLRARLTLLHIRIISATCKRTQNTSNIVPSTTCSSFNEEACTRACEPHGPNTLFECW